MQGYFPGKPTFDCDVSFVCICMGFLTDHASLFDQVLGYHQSMQKTINIPVIIGTDVKKLNYTYDIHTSISRLIVCSRDINVSVRETPLIF